MSVEAEVRALVQLLGPTGYPEDRRRSLAIAILRVASCEEPSAYDHVWSAIVDDRWLRLAEGSAGVLRGRGLKHPDVVLVPRDLLERLALTAGPAEVAEVKLLRG